MGMRLVRRLLLRLTTLRIGYLLSMEISRMHKSGVDVDVINPGIL